MDEILGYLLNDLAALKAYSLTYKRLFGATRPLIQKWLYLAPRQNRKAHPKPKGSLFGRRKRAPEEFERLIGADRWGILCYTQNLTFEMGGDSSRPRNAQEYLPHLRSITELRTLTLIIPRAHLFIQVFDVMNISAFSPTLYDTSTYGTPTTRRPNGSCTSYASSRCWKTQASCLQTRRLCTWAPRFNDYAVTAPPGKLNFAQVCPVTL